MARGVFPSRTAPIARAAIAASLCALAPAHGEPPEPDRIVLPREIAPVVPLATPEPLKAAAAPTGTPAERQRWLSARIDEILAPLPQPLAKIGIAVAEVETGHLLYARNENLAENPASNVKLFTTAAALALLGPEYRWKTTLYADEVKAGDVSGNLYLKGAGDPSLVGEDLWKLASDLGSGGIRRVTGDLVIDDTAFDDERLGPGFAQKNEDLPFRAPNGAVSLNYNACSIHVLPGDRDGAAGRILVEPTSPYFEIVNETRTVISGRTNLTIGSRDVDSPAGADGKPVDPGAGRTKVTVSGRIRRGEPEHVEFRRVGHPDLYTGYSFRELLGRRGIKIGGKILRGAVPTTAKPVGTPHYSAPLGVLIRDVNKRSNNFMAEQIMKTLGAEVMGRPGTWPKGVDAVAKFLDGLGIPREQYRMTNGSGLYDSNRFTAQQMVTLLRTAFRDFRWAADFVGSLSLAGADGTIGHRLEGSPAERYVRAKTGTLAGVSCLSGYAGGPGRMPLAFSILMNNLPENASADARRAQDAIAEALVAYLAAK